MKNEVKILGILLGSFCLFVSEISTAQPTRGGKKISSELFGLFFEDINYAADGGIYAEMIQNRSFEYSPTDRRDWHPFSFWHYTTPGYSYGTVDVETTSPVHPNNPHYIVLEAEHVGHEEKHTGESGVGIKNTGFNGMVIRAGEQYNFSLFARQLSANPVEVTVSLENHKNEKVAGGSITISSGDWQKYATTLTASKDCDSASLVILAKTNGRMAMDMISLFPEKTFKNRANGLRADLAQMLADMQPRFIRFPGGCLVHGDGLGNMYRWKNTIGPLEERVGQKNIWGYHQSAGLGFYEYFQFCEDVGAKPVPVLPAGVSCQNSGGTWRIGGTGQKALPQDEMPEYISEVLDLIEWANGPVTSKWGAKRAAAGHPEPFNLEYVGIGNEDKITPEFKERFEMIYNAVKEKHPEIKIIGTSGPFSDGEDFDRGWEFIRKLKVPVVDEHYYKDPEWFLANHYRYDPYDRKGSKVYLGEYASWGNKLYNAITEAAYMTGLERNGDVVIMASYAPLLAKKDFTQWNTDMIFFDNNKIVPTPNFYVQKMFMTNRGDYYFDQVVQTNNKDSLQAASCVADSETGDIILKLVNVDKQNKNFKIDLSRFNHLDTNATITVLQGDAGAENTFDNPQYIVPVKSDYKIEEKFDYNTPPMSLTVIRINNK